MIILQEDVGRLQISMDYAATINTGISIENLIHENDGLWLRNLSFVGDGLGEIASITKFRDDVCVILGIVDIVDFDDVLTILQNFENLDLRSQQVLMDLTLDHLHIDHLYGHCFIYACMERTGEVVSTPEDLTRVSLADIVTQNVGVILEFLSDGPGLIGFLHAHLEISNNFIPNIGQPRFVEQFSIRTIISKIYHY